MLQLCYDGWWEMLADGRMEYLNSKEYKFFGLKRLYIDKLSRVQQARALCMQQTSHCVPPCHTKFTLITLDIRKTHHSTQQIPRHTF